MSISLLELLGLLKLQFGRLLLHLVVHHAAQLARVAAQNLACLAHAVLVLLERLPPDARPEAVVYVVFEAGLEPPFGHAVARQRQPAGARLVQFLYEVEHGIHARGVAVRPEVLPALLVDVARLEYTRIRVVGHADAGVGLSVLEQHVVARVVLLDETVLKQQRVLLGVDHGVAYVAYLRYEHLGLVAVHLLVEVR